MSSFITIPPPEILPYPSKSYDECGCGNPIFKTTILGSHTTYRFNENFLHFYNDKKIIIKEGQNKTIFFNNLILTSVPAEYIVFCNKYAYKFGLSHRIKSYLTNDRPIQITLFNHTKKTINILPNQLEIICCIVLTGNHKF